MSKVSQPAFYDVFIEAIDAASPIVRRSFGQLKDQDIRYKDDARKEVLTHADEEAQRTIIAILQKAYPDMPILAEEDGMHEEFAPDHDGQLRFAVDPIDGTMNYAQGKDGNGMFSITIGVQKGLEGGWQPHAGVVYHVLEDKLYIADQGQAWCVHAGERTRLSLDADEDEAASDTSILSGQTVEAVGYLLNNQHSLKLREVFEHALKPHGVVITKYFSSAIQIARIARAELDGAVILGDPNDWDVAGAYAIACAAGATMVTTEVPYKGRTIALTVIARQAGLAAIIERELSINIAAWSRHGSASAI